MIHVVIVDDHELFRLGVKTAILSNHSDIHIVGEAETGAELFSLLAHTKADMVLLDILLPDMLGVDIVRRLKSEHPKLKILAISVDNSAYAVQELLEVGIDGFISKRRGGMEALTEAIRSIMRGFDYFGKDISEIIYRIYLSKKRTTEVSSEFTKQEKRIIKLCCEGLSSKLIADRLDVSPRTVETHKNNIFRKLGINSTSEMVSYAVKNGIIRLSD
jgi:DNA-binding NarL/FixJ family response regulator